VTRFLWLASLILLGSSAVCWAGEVTLRMRGGQYEVRGHLVSFDARSFVVEIPAVGRLVLRADRYTCISETCPGATPQALVVARADVRRPRERR